VSPNNKVKIMAPKKLTNYIPPKGEGDSAVIFIPTLTTAKLWLLRHDRIRGILIIQICTHSDGRIRVSPENVTEKAGVWNITRPCNVSDLFHLAQFRTQAPMHADNFVINNSSTR
jgi:hypothetical protein